MKIRYVYFYDNANNPELEEQYPDMSDEERAKQISENYGVPFSIFLAPEKMREIEDLSAEGNKTIRVIERENGQKAYLRFYFQGGWKDSPGEAEISAAFKRLASEVPTIGFLAGHGERNIYREGDREYKRISSDKNTRSSMINQGFNIEEVYLHSALPDSIDIRVESTLVGGRDELFTGVYQSRRKSFRSRRARAAGIDEPDYRTVWSSFYAGTVGAANPVTSG